MSVRKRKWTTSKGETREAWLVDYVDQLGERHAQTFERKKDADAYHATVRVDVGKGTHIAPHKSLTIAEAAETWIKRVEADGRERTTVRQYRQHVDLHIVPRLGTAKVAHLTTPRLEAFRDELLASVSRPMARKVLTSLKSLLRTVGRGDVAASVRIKRDRRKEKKLEVGVDIPEPKEIKRIIDATPDARRRALVLVAAMCGLRASELRGLRWSDVDLKGSEPELHVRQRADRYGVIGAPKSDSGTRRVPLSPDVVTALKTWKLACPVGDLVFPTSTGAIEHHANMLRSLSGAMVAAGVVDDEGRPKYALHAFRHFFASWCLNPVERGGLGLGDSPKEVQTLLGHSSIVMTIDIYGHLFPATGDGGKRLAAASRALLA